MTFDLYHLYVYAASEYREMRIYLLVKPFFISLSFLANLTVHDLAYQILEESLSKSSTNPGITSSKSYHSPDRFMRTVSCTEKKQSLLMAKKMVFNQDASGREMKTRAFDLRLH